MSRLFLSHPLLRCGLIAVSLSLPACAQTAPPAASAPAKASAFDSISIRPSPAVQNGPAHWGVGPDTYAAVGMPLSTTFYMAFFTQGMPVKELTEGMPDWVSSTRYDITAKVDEATAEQWKTLKPQERREHAMPLIRAMLADRFKLQVHRIPTEVEAFALIVSKGGPKMAAASPNETAPTSGPVIPMPEGGWMLPYQRGEIPHMTLLNATMAQLAQRLGNTGTIIIDQTGLTGRYDLMVSTSDPTAEGMEMDASPSERAHYWDVTAIGLELKPIKVPADKIVIDHIERPSEN